MAYTTSAEVQSEFKNVVFSTTTLVTLADVAKFIEESDALINSYVGMKYETPVEADDSSLALLRMFSRTIVADRIKKILEVKQSTNSAGNQDVRGAYSTKDVLKALDEIKKGNVSLSGATALLSGGGFYSRNSANSQETTFHRDDKEW